MHTCQCCWCCSVTSERHSTSNSLWPHRLNRPWNSPGQITGVGSLYLFQGILPTQGLNPSLPHYRQILYQLSHKGSPTILEWVAIPSLADLPDPGIEPGSPALQVDSLLTELPGKSPRRQNLKERCMRSADYGRRVPMSTSRLEGRSKLNIHYSPSFHTTEL